MLAKSLDGKFYTISNIDPQVRLRMSHEPYLSHSMGLQSICRQFKGNVRWSRSVKKTADRVVSPVARWSECPTPHPPSRLRTGWLQMRTSGHHRRIYLAMSRRNSKLGTSMLSSQPRKPHLSNQVSLPHRVVIDCVLRQAHPGLAYGHHYPYYHQCK